MQIWKQKLHCALTARGNIKRTVRFSDLGERECTGATMPVIWRGRMTRLAHRYWDELLASFPK